MTIRIETRYIAENGYDEKAIPLGACARLTFHDGTFHKGDIEKITEESITISRNDGKYSYAIHEIRDIELCG